MPKITLKEFWNSDKKHAIHCDAYEKANILCGAFSKMRNPWLFGGNHWEVYKENTCYTNAKGFNSKNILLECGYTIYEFEDILFSDTKKPKYKIQITIECDSINTEEIESIKGIKSWTVERL